MSGPKSSRYTLTAEQREAQRLEREREQLKQARQRLSRLMAQAESAILRHRAVAGEAASACEDLMRQCAPLLSAGLTNDRAALAEMRRSVLLAGLSLEKEIRALDRDSGQLEARLRRQIDSDIKQGYGATLDSILDARRDEKRRRLERRMAALEQIASGAVSIDTANHARRLIEQLRQSTSEAFADMVYVTSIQPLIKQFRKEQAQFQTEETEYQLLLLQYEALCQELSVPIEPQPWTPGALKGLQATVERMDAQALRREEEAYIHQTLDEVMQEMGYPLLGQREVTKRSGKHLRHVLYAFEDGTGIDVTYSDDGQIAMELGGLDDCDRIPDDRELVFLCDAMDDFCTSFEQLEARLKRRGVVPRERIHMLPPSEENAQIINTRDYALNAQPTVLHVERRRSRDPYRKQTVKDED